MMSDGRAERGAARCNPSHPRGTRRPRADLLGYRRILHSVVLERVERVASLRGPDRIARAARCLGSRPPPDSLALEGVPLCPWFQAPTGVEEVPPNGVFDEERRTIDRERRSASHHGAPAPRTRSVLVAYRHPLRAKGKRRPHGRGMVSVLQSDPPGREESAGDLRRSVGDRAGSRFDRPDPASGSPNPLKLRWLVVSEGSGDFAGRRSERRKAF